jgi:hypothetical protein
VCATAQIANQSPRIVFAHYTAANPAVKYAVNLNPGFFELQVGNCGVTARLQFRGFFTESR